MMNVGIEEVIPAVAKIGYRGIELAVTPRFPTDLYSLDAAARARIKALCQQHGLIISAVAGHTSVCEDDPDKNAANLQRLHDTINLADELRQAGQPAIVCSLLGGHVDDWGRVKDRVVERVAALGDYAAARGVIFACEPHSGTAFDLPRKAVWLMEQLRHSAVRINFDISHFDILAIPIAECVPQTIPWSAHTHVKDQRGIYPYHGVPDPRRRPVRLHRLPGGHARRGLHRLDRHGGQRDGTAQARLRSIRGCRAGLLRAQARVLHVGRAAGRVSASWASDSVSSQLG
jgi:sugar phosphate isomerase/epimerase